MNQILGYRLGDIVLEIRRIENCLETPLIQFYNTVSLAGDEVFFHPHPFDELTARKVAYYSGKDIYYALLDGSRIIGYGMLRGWDEGYDVPSLGIIILPEMRRRKLGNLLMHFLHTEALYRGAKMVRLTVHRDNSVAITMYKKFGYSFKNDNSEQLLGILNLQ